MFQCGWGGDEPGLGGFGRREAGDRRLQALGVEIGPNNDLMRQCGDHLQEALALGRLVLHPFIGVFARAAKMKCETLHTDAEIFEAWSSFVASGEKLSAFQPLLSQRPSLDERLRASHGLQLVAAGKDLISNITRARAPMPKSTREFVERLELYRSAWAPRPSDEPGAGSLSNRVVGASRSGEGASHGLPPEPATDLPYV